MAQTFNSEPILSENYFEKKSAEPNEKKNSGMSRQKKVKPDRQTVSFSATHDEKKQIIEKAQRMNVNMSNFLRWRALADNQIIDKIKKENTQLKNEIVKLRVNSDLHFSNDEKTKVSYLFSADQIKFLFERLVAVTPRGNKPELWEIEILKKRLLEAVLDSVCEKDDEGEPDEQDHEKIKKLFFDLEEI